MDASGVFFTRYAADRSLVRTKWQLLSLLLLVAVLLVLPAWVGGRWVGAADPRSEGTAISQ